MPGADGRGGDLERVVVDRAGQRDRRPAGAGRSRAAASRRRPRGRRSGGQAGRAGARARTVEHARAQAPLHRPTRATCCGVHARTAVRHRRVPRARHRDQRSRRRSLRADRGRRGAGRRRRAARRVRARSSAWRTRWGAASSASPGSRRRWSTRRPRPRTVLPELGDAAARARARRAQRRASTSRVLRQAFARAALEWPAPPVICTVALARRFAPLQRRRGLATLAAALGIEVDAVHRALPDARTCARVFCALFGRLCANAPTIGDALALLGAAQGPLAAGRRSSARAASARTSPGSRTSRASTSSATPTGAPLYVGKSVDLRTRARSHFTTGATWAARGRARRPPGRRSQSSARCCSRTG